MAKSQPESKTEVASSQDNFLVKARVYAQLKNLTKFDALIFKKMAALTHPAARKSIKDWDAFKADYQSK